MQLFRSLKKDLIFFENFNKFAEFLFNACYINNVRKLKTLKFFENCSVGVKASTILFHGIDSGALPLPSTTSTN